MCVWPFRQRRLIWCVVEDLASVHVSRSQVLSESCLECSHVDCRGDEGEEVEEEEEEEEELVRRMQNNVYIPLREIAVSTRT